MRISDWSSDVCSSDLLHACSRPGDSAVKPHSQAKSLCVHSLDGFDQRPGLPHCHMDDRTEPFSIKFFHIVQPNDGRGHEQPPDRHIDRFDNAPAHALAIGHQLVISGLINHRSRSEEHTSELQSLLRISYAILCLKTK